MNQAPPTKTNADRNREYRARHNDRINEGKRNKRKALKAIIKVEGEIETPILKKVAKLPKATISEPQEITKQNYASFIRAFYKIGRAHSELQSECALPILTYLLPLLQLLQ